jgi:hypothetical protein
MKMTSQNVDLLWLTNPLPPYLTAQRTAVPNYRVGEPLQCGRRSWPAGAQYHYAAQGHELTIFHPDIDEGLIHDVKRGELEFALMVQHPVLLLAYRFGASRAWSDIPYCWHMQPSHARIVPPTEASPEARALLWISLVGAGDGLIHAQRGVTLAPEFTRALHEAIRAQAESCFQPYRCMDALADLLITRPSTMHRLPLAQARTVGNR